MTIGKGRMTQIISEIVILLHDHKTYTEIYSNYGQMWGISKKTFDRYVKQAREIHLQQVKATENILSEHYVNEAKKRLKNALFGKEEVLKRLMEIVKTAKRESDKINALRLIVEIEGYKAPVRNETEVTVNTPIFLENPLLNGIIDITEAQDILSENTTEIEPEPDEPQDDEEEATPDSM